MTEQAEVARAEQSALGGVAAVMGRDILGAIVQALKTAPDHWARMSEKTQNDTINRLRDTTRSIVNNALHVLVAGAEFKAVPVELEGVTFKDGIKGSFKAPKQSPGRHELADAEGTSVLIVLADPEQFLERLSDIKADADQFDLFGGNYDPNQDRPPYRRDEQHDRLSPASTGFMSWAELKEKLNAGQITKEKAEEMFGGELPEEPPSEEDEAKRRAASAAKVEVLRGDGTWEEVAFEDLKKGLIFRQGDSEPCEALGAPYQGDDGAWWIDTQPVKPMAFGAAAAEQTPGTAEGESAAQDADARGELHELQDGLAAVHVHVGLATLQTFSEAQIRTAKEWLAAYTADPDGCKIARPHWLPMPDDGGSESGDDENDDSEPTSEG